MRHVHRDISSTLKIDEKLHLAKYGELIDPLGRGKISEQEFWDLYAESFKIPKPVPIGLLNREFIKRYNVFGEVIALVKRLKKKGYKVAILSNTIKSHADVNIKKGIYDEFRIRILSHEVGFRKPEAEIYRLALGRLKTKPGDAIFIDDDSKMVDGAKKLGICGVVFRGYPQLVRDLQNLGVNVS